MESLKIADGVFVCGTTTLTPRPALLEFLREHHIRVVLCVGLRPDRFMQELPAIRYVHRPLRAGSRPFGVRMIVAEARALRAHEGPLLIVGETIVSGAAHRVAKGVADGRAQA